MNNFLNLSIIAELSKKKDILLNDLITLFFRILPTVIIVSLISLILAYINFLILKNFKIQNGELYKSNIIFSNLTIINPEDSYFNDINTVLQQPINVKTLLRNFSISDLLKNTPELKDKYKIDIDKNFSKAALPKSNTVDLKFSIF